MILIAFVNSQCVDQFAHSGKICVYDQNAPEGSQFVSYDTPTAFCDAGGDPANVMDYCKVSPCEACNDSYAICFFGNYVMDKNYETGIEQTGVDPYKGDCKVSHEEFCYRSIFSTNDPHDLIKNYNEGVTPKPTDPPCCIYECYEKFNFTQQACGTNGVFYTNITTYCQDWCNNRTLYILDCFSSDQCNATHGCVDPCLIETPDAPFCSTQTYTLYTDRPTFCADKQTNPALTEFLCDNVCDEAKCKKQQCLDLNSSYPLNWSVCLPQTNHGSLFFSTIDEYCQSMIDENKPVEDYAIVNYLNCGGQACADQGSCCSSGCLNSYNTSCNSNDHTLVTPSAFCTDFCAGTVISVNPCFNPLDPSAQIDCQDCGYFSCFYSELANFNQTEEVCASNNTFYSNKAAFCSAQQTIAGLVVVYCGPNDTKCSTTETCCEGNCSGLVDSSYIPVCDTDLNLYSTASEFCSGNCNNPNLNIRQCGDANCSESECCQAKCIADNPNTNVCLVGNPDVYSISFYCEFYCNNVIEANMLINCDGECTADDCFERKCNHDNTEGNFCLDNGSFFNNRASFCSAQTLDRLSTSIDCNGGECSTADECCETACIKKNANFTPRCDSQYNTYNNVSDYCQAQCGANGSSDAMCDNGNGIPELCSVQQCCEKKCTSSDYSAVCDTEFALVDKTDFCEQSCGPQPPVFVECEGACTPDLCRVKECADHLNIHAGTICLVEERFNKVFFGSIESYCFDLVQDGIDLFSVGVVDNCADGACTVNRCCEERCLLNEYFNTCADSNTDFLSKPEFCFQSCENNPPFFTKCYDENDPTVQIDCTECTISSCLSVSFSGVTFDKICLKNPYDQKLFFASKADYCLAKIDNQDTNYTNLANELTLCDGGECADEGACCTKQCNDNSRDLIGCNEHDVLVNQSTVCSNSCAGNPFSLVYYCGLSDCIACENKKCFLDNQQYTGKTVCSKDGALDILHLFFWEDLNSFCSTHYNDENQDYQLTTDNALMCGTDATPGADNSCADMFACCKKNCQVKYPDLDVCFNGNVITRDTACSEKCLGVLTFDQVTFCGNQDCTSCDNIKCFADNNNYQLNSVCLKKENTFDITQDIFWSSLNDFCLNVFTDETVTYTIPTDAIVTCDDDGNCADADECCMTDCRTRYIDLKACNENDQVVSREEVCQHECSGNTPFTELIYCAGQDCTECTYKTCFQENVDFTLSTVCTKQDVLEINNFVFYGSVFDFCNAFGPSNLISYKLESSNTVSCNSGECSSFEECCEKNCTDQTNYLASCSTTQSDVLNQNEYCQVYCANSENIKKCFDENDPTVQVACTECAFSNCMAALADLANADKICLDGEHNGEFFFESKEKYCEALIENGDINFSLAAEDLVLCGGGVCVDKGTCCSSRCIGDIPDLIGCKGYTSDDLVNRTQICDDKCLPSPLFPAVTFCGSENCVGCENKDCYDSNTNFGSTNICVQKNQLTFTSDIFWISINEYCNGVFDGNQVINYTLDSHVISCDTDNDPNTDNTCGDLEACCLAGCRLRHKDLISCNENNDLVNREAVCNQECSIGTAFTEIVYCGEQDCTTCAQKECYKDNQDYSLNTVCVQENSLTFSTEIFWSDINAFCVDVFDANVQDYELTGKTIECDEDNDPSTDNSCFDKDTCCMKQCRMANLDLTGCNENNELVDRDMICTQKCANTPYTEVIYCGGQNCSTCDKKKCYTDIMSYNLTTVCSNENIQPNTLVNKFWANLFDFCEEAYVDNSIDYSLSTTNTISCDLDNDPNTDNSCLNSQACCEQRCNMQTYIPACATSEADVLSKEQFCSISCSDPNSIRKCYSDDDPNQAVACTECSMTLCISASFTNATESKVCLINKYNNKAFFLSKTAYCQELIDNNDSNYVSLDGNLASCDGGECADEAACCSGRCTSLFRQYDACDNTDAIVTPGDVCQRFCNDNPFPELVFCGQSNCTSCDHKKCFSDNSDYTLSSVCSKDDQLNVSGVFYWDTLINYCSTVFTNDNADYSIAGKTIACDFNNPDNSCLSEAECCKTNCLANYIARCDSNSQLLTGEAYCSAECSTPLADTKICKDSNNNQVDCTQDYCTNHDCMTIFRDNFSFNAVCLQTPVNDTTFFDTVLSFCQNGSVQITQLPSTYTCKDDQNNDVECQDNDHCCKASCMAETFFDGCKPDTFGNPIDQEAFCTNRCSADNQERTDIVLRNCTDDDNNNISCGNCFFIKCELEAVVGYSLTSYCLKNPVNNLHFFSDITSYCKNAGTTDSDYQLTSDSYNICDTDNDPDSDNSCADKEACCKSRCLDETYSAGCHQNSFVLLDQNNYCDLNCSITDFVQHTCKDDNDVTTDCLAKDCCLKKLTNDNTPDNVCGSDGQVYSSHSDFCDANIQENGPTVRLQTNPANDTCGSDFSYYADLATFCTAAAANLDLTSTGDCESNDCGIQYCCDKQCVDVPFQAYLIHLTDNSVYVFDNQCYATCFTQVPGQDSVAGDDNCIKPASNDEYFNRKECKMHFCEEKQVCTGDATQHGCAEDGEVYDNPCLANCADNNEFTVCDADCKTNEVRMTGCKYACQVKFVDL